MDEHRTAVDGQDARQMHESIKEIGLAGLPTVDSESVVSVSAGMANSLWVNMAAGLGICMEPEQWAHGVW